MIDLPVILSNSINHNGLNNPKNKKNKSRDISSAITNATPIYTNNNISYINSYNQSSSTKLRSRSSFSQYRKKDSSSSK